MGVTWPTNGRISAKGKDFKTKRQDFKREGKNFCLRKNFKIKGWNFSRVCVCVKFRIKSDRKNEENKED